MVAHTSVAPKPTSVVQARYNEAFFPRPLCDSAFDPGNAWPLSGSLAPIDDDRLAGKKRRFAGKERDGVGGQSSSRRPIPGAKESSTVEWHSARTVFRPISGSFHPD